MTISTIQTPSKKPSRNLSREQATRVRQQGQRRECQHEHIPMMYLFYGLMVLLFFGGSALLGYAAYDVQRERKEIFARIRARGSKTIYLNKDDGDDDNGE